MRRILGTIGWLVAAAVCLSPFSAHAGRTLSIATGSPSGIYYPYGGGLASIWSKQLPHVNMKAEVTGGSLTNVLQVSRKESELGIAMGDVVKDAYAGTGKFPHAMPVRALFALYPNIVHLITLKDSDIASVADLRGKRVSLGAPGSGTAIAAENILKALNVEESSFQAQYLNYGGTTDGLRNGTIDAGFIVGGIGVAAVVELALTRDIRLVPFDKAQLQAIHKINSAYTPFVIPQDAYRGVDTPVPTPSLWNVLVVHKDMDDALAYDLTKTAFAHKKTLEGIAKVARYTTPQNANRLANVPMHPGAKRYFGEHFSRKDKPARRNISATKGQLLITNEAGQRLGFVDDVPVKEIPDAYVFQAITGLVPAKLEFRVPRNSAYTVLLSGQTLTNPEIVTLSQTGKDFTRVKGIELRPTSRDMINFRANNNGLTYKPNEDREITLKKVMDKYWFEIQGADINANKTLDFYIDIPKGKLTLNYAQANDSTYTLYIERDEFTFLHKNLTINAGDAHHINFGSWGSEDTMEYCTDVASDGSVDRCDTLTNMYVASEAASPGTSTRKEPAAGE